MPVQGPYIHACDLGDHAMTERRRPLSKVAAAAAVLTLAACGQPTGNTADAPDPFEGANRAIHEFNKGLDRTVLKPTSEAYVAVVPGPARAGVSNGVNTLSQPVYIANHLLQGDIEDAGGSFFRMMANVLFGAGVLDPAADMGVIDRPTDFGETLAVWGIDSGPYVELPLFGPSTVRDAFGAGVDIVADPVPQALDADYRPYLVAAQVADVLQIRQDFARVIEMLLYESADSYSAARIAYLQNRANELSGGDASELQLENPYEFE